MPTWLLLSLYQRKTGEDTRGSYAILPWHRLRHKFNTRLDRGLFERRGGVNRNAELSTVMKELIAIKKKQNKS
jgi:hypothetical protein